MNVRMEEVDYSLVDVGIFSGTFFFQITQPNGVKKQCCRRQKRNIRSAVIQQGWCGGKCTQVDKVFSGTNVVLAPAT